MASCLVTGGAGFIGSRLVEALVARGDKVRVLDNFSTGDLNNLDNVRHEVEIVFGDLNNHDLLQNAAQGIDLFFQLAGPLSSNFEAPELAARWANPSENLHALMAACRAKVKRFIYASSCAVYGQGGTKETDWVVPVSSYGFAKLAGEVQCLGFTSLYGLETVRLRYSHTYGPRQSVTSAYSRSLLEVVQAMLAGQAPLLEDPAEHHNDFIHVDDIIHATLLAAEAPRVSGQVYNIARGRPVTLLEIVGTINQLRGSKIEPICNMRDFQMPPAKPIDISRAEMDLGFCPSIPLRQGLLGLIEHCTRQSAFTTAAAQEGIQTTSVNPGLSRATAASVDEDPSLES